jgi:hypothetical protein
MYRRMKQEFWRVLTSIGPLSVKVFALLTHIYRIVIENEVITWATVFFSWHYKPLWVFAFSEILFHSALSSHCFLHRLIPIICKSSSMFAIHLLLLSCFFQLPPLWCSCCSLQKSAHIPGSKSHYHIWRGLLCYPQICLHERSKNYDKSKRG